MDPAIVQEFNAAYAEALSPPWSGSVDEWCSQYVELPNAYAIPGKFDVTYSPYLKQPFKDFRDPTIRMVNLYAATQCAKSLCAELFIPYVIVNDPGPMMRLHQSDEMAATFTETRLIPLLKACPPVKQLLAYNRFAATKRGINLPHMNIKIGSAKETLLHGMSLRYLLMDEVHLYDKGVVEKAIARTTAFAQRRKIIISSQPSESDSELAKYANAGLVYVWQWRCFKCGEYQNWEWNKLWPDKTSGSGYGVTWDKKVDSDKNYLMDETGATARLVCKSCRHEHADTQSNRRRLVDEGRYHCIKTDGDTGVRTYMWPGFVNPAITFKEKVVQYLQAKNKERFFGLADDLQTFYNQVLGVEWKKGERLEPSRILVQSYDTNAEWPEEGARFMTVDYQRANSIKYYLIRAWSDKGDSRLLAHGYVTNWDEIEALRVRWKVPIANVGVDSGYSSEEVYGESVKRGAPAQIGKMKVWVGWTCLKGDGQKKEYLHKDGVKRYYSQEIRGDPNFPMNSKYRGLVARVYLWSNYSVKSILARLRDNQTHSKWVSNTQEQAYLDQLHSEVFDGLKNRWVPKNEHNPNNHYWDLENMNLVMAMMLGCFASTPSPQREAATVEVESPPAE